MNSNLQTLRATRVVGLFQIAQFEFRISNFGLKGLLLVALSCFSLLTWTMIVLALTASQSLAQSFYEPYTFITLAGLAGSDGTADGAGSEARFGAPTGMAVDIAGNVYVTDFIYQTIRKVTPAGVSSTLAGLTGSGGSMNGTGSAARFNFPSGVAVDGTGNVYVADLGNNTIRKVTPAGAVTTLAGLATDENRGSADGTGRDARFNSPWAVAVDSTSNVYVADSSNFTIRKVTPAGVVTMLAGLAGENGSADGTGSAARFGVGGGIIKPVGPAGVALDIGKVYVADNGNNTIRKGYAEPVTEVNLFDTSGPSFNFILTGPSGQSVVVEASTDLVSWLPLWTNTFTGALHFSDPQSGVYSNRFYRAHLP